MRPIPRSAELGFSPAPLLVDAFLAKLMEGLTGGAVLAGLAIHLGGSDAWIGALAALLLFAQLAQFGAFAAPWRVRSRKRVSIGGALGSRVVLGSTGLVALMEPGPGALGLLTVLLGAAAVFSAVSAIGWACWIRDLVPGPMLGRVFAWRLVAQAAGGASGVLGAGLALGLTPVASHATAFALIFLFAGTAGIASLFAARRIPESPWNPAEAGVSLRGLLARSWRGRDTRPVILFSGAWGFAAGLGLPFLAVYLLREVGLSFALVALLSLASLASGLLTTIMWGRIADRAGSGLVLSSALPVLVVCLLLVGILPASPGLLLLVHLLLGASVAGVEVATARLVTRRAPFTGAAGLLATAAVARAACAGIACVLAGVLASTWGSATITVLADQSGRSVLVTISRYDVLFIAGALASLFAWHRALALNEPEGRGRDVAHEIQIELHALSSLRSVRSLGHLAAHLARHGDDVRSAPRSFGSARRAP